MSGQYKRKRRSRRDERVDGRRIRSRQAVWECDNEIDKSDMEQFSGQEWRKNGKEQQQEL